MKLKLRDIVILILLFSICGAIIFYGIEHKVDKVQIKGNNYETIYNSNLEEQIGGSSGSDDNNGLLFFSTLGGSAWSGGTVYVTPETTVYLDSGAINRTWEQNDPSNMVGDFETSKGMFNQYMKVLVDSSANLGYTFSITCRQAFNTSRTSTINFQVVWEENIKYFSNGNECGSTRRATFSNNIRWTLPSAPIAPAGYRFDGWYDANGNKVGDAGNGVTFNYTAHNQTTNLYAKWVPLEYEVSFNSNGGIGTMNNQKFKYGEGQALTKNSFTKNKYKFIGWDTNSAGTTVVYTDGQTISNITKNTNLYAVWEQVQFAINYSGLEGMSQSNPSIYEKGKQIELTPATKNGYRFMGWYTDSNYQNKIEKLTSDTIKKDTTLYAYFEKEYSITYENVKGATHSNPETYIKTQDIKLEDAIKEGYKFLGWYTDLEYKNKIENLSKNTVNADMKIYACFGNEYTIKYEYQDLTNEKVYEERNSITKMAPEGTVISKEDIENVDGYEIGEIIPEKLTISKDSNILIVRYNRKKIAIKFRDADNNIISEEEVKYEGKISEPIGKPSKDGYKFTGWYLDQNKDGIADTNNKFDFENTSITSEINLIPGWEKLTIYIIKLECNGKLQEITYDETMGEISLPKPTNKEGYSCEYWYTNSNYEGETIKSITPEKIASLAGTEIKLYAKYTKNKYQYTINYYFEDLNEEYKKEDQYTKEQEELYETEINTYPQLTEEKIKGFELDKVTPQSFKISTKVHENVMNVYYKRKTSTISVKVPGGEEVKDIELKYGQKLEEPSVTPRPGYEFLGWYDDKNNNNQIDDQEEKFDFERTDITEDLNIIANWELIHYKVNYNLDSSKGEENSPNNPEIAHVEYLEVLHAPTKEGYTFIEWQNEEGKKVTSLKEVLDKMLGMKTMMKTRAISPIQINLKPIWEPNEDTKYKITAKFEGINGEEDKTIEFPKTGTTDEKINVKEILGEYEGFEIDDSKSDKLTTNIKGDGNTKVNVYFKRKEYTINYDLGNKTLSIKLKYGETLEKIPEPSKEGYTFEGWRTEDGKDEDITNAVDENKKLIAKWKANKSNYKVSYYKENSEDEFELIKTDTIESKTDEQVKVEPSEIEGYELDIKNPDYLDSGKVKSDGSLELKIFYKRKTYTVKYEDPKTGETKEEKLKYEETYKIEETDIPEKQGYTFVGWITQDGNLFDETVKIDNDLKLSLYYEPNTNTPYRVNYYKKSDSKKYEFIGSNVYFGTTDTTVQVELKNLVGYKVNGKKSDLGGKVLADGTAEFNIYYDIDNPNIVETGDIYYIVIAIIILLFVSNGVITVKRKKNQKIKKSSKIKK